jgi:hypothetical protein
MLSYNGYETAPQKVQHYHAFRWPQGKVTGPLVNHQRYDIDAQQLMQLRYLAADERFWQGTVQICCRISSDTFQIVR